MSKQKRVFYNLSQNQWSAVDELLAKLCEYAFLPFRFILLREDMIEI